ncbi:MAG: P-loop NTPase [Deltaproteobacteria bacterium]|nr:P-loop NTPase [Deltaproteobacteria bacterium]
MNPSRDALKVIAIAGGKGGVGKTQVAVNLAVALHRRGQRVLVIDADLGLANADLLLDVVPQAGLVDVARGLVAIEDALVESPHGPVLLGGGGAMEARHGARRDQGEPRLDDREKLALIGALDSVGGAFDVVLIDTPAGLGDPGIFFARAAAEVCLVTTAEPTALADTYATARALLRRSARRRLGLVVNQVTGARVAQAVHDRLRLLVHRFLGADLAMNGWIPFDPEVHHAVMRRSPIAATRPEAPASRRMAALADTLLYDAAPAGPDPSGELRLFWRALMARTGAENSHKNTGGVDVGDRECGAWVDPAVFGGEYRSHE